DTTVARVVRVPPPAPGTASEEPQAPASEALPAESALAESALARHPSSALPAVLGAGVRARVPRGA
ncbi:MAG TPA: hypothetical protein VF000_07085, partial [Agromyces sp.]